MTVKTVDAVGVRFSNGQASFSTSGTVQEAIRK